MFENLSLGVIAIYACFIFSGFYFEMAYGLLLGLVAAALFVTGFHADHIPFATLIVLTAINCFGILWKVDQDPNTKVININLDFLSKGAKAEVDTEAEAVTAVHAPSVDKGKDKKKASVVQIAILIGVLGLAGFVYMTFYAEKKPCPPSEGELMHRQALKNRDSKMLAKAAELMKNEKPASERCPK